jgi:hypothetical protein
MPDSEFRTTSLNPEPGFFASEFRTRIPNNNIAEGFDRGTNPELLTFLYLAHRPPEVSQIISEAARQTK